MTLLAEKEKFNNHCSLLQLMGWSVRSKKITLPLIIIGLGFVIASSILITTSAQISENSISNENVNSINQNLSLDNQNYVDAESCRNNGGTIYFDQSSQTYQCKL